MSIPGPYAGYSREDLLRYVNGTMLPAEMHALEKAALEDPFLSDAIEGLMQENADKLRVNLEILDERLSSKKNAKGILIPAHRTQWRWAAAALLSGLIGIAAYFFSQKNEQEPLIARQEQSYLQDTNKLKNEDQPLAITAPSPEKKIKNPVTNEKNNPVETVKPDQTPKPALAQSDKIVSEQKESIAKLKEEENLKTTKTISPPEAVRDEAVAGQAARSDNNMPAMKRRSGITEKEQGIYYYNGQILNTQNQPLPFTNISILPSNKPSYSDVHGNFRLVTGDSSLQVEIRADGYKPQIVQLSNFQNNQRVFLQRASDNKKKSKTRLRIQVADSNRLQANAEKSDIAEAEPMDGYENYEWYLRNNIRITGDIKNYQNRGLVDISFLVSETGRLSDFRVEKSLCPACDNEVIRLIKEGPPWKVPGSKKSIRATIGIVF